MQTYPPVHRCIYCGTDQGPFGDEHIIPYGLGGKFVLPKASCRACETITGRFEGECLRSIMGHMRVKRGLPTRRKRDRPKKLPIHLINHDHTTETLHVPVAEHPTGLLLFKFERARALLGLPKFESTQIRAVPWWFGPSLPQIVGITQKFQKKGFGFGAFDPAPFCRMLAKVAHSFAVAEVGLEAFKPTVLGLILGESLNLGHFVGGSLDDPPPAEAGDRLHAIRWRGLRVNGRPYIVVDIRLFADLGAPIYHVVVGEASQQTVARYSLTTAAAQSP